MSRFAGHTDKKSLEYRLRHIERTRSGGGGGARIVAVVGGSGGSVATGSTYTHSQGTAAAIWTISHGQGRHPSVTIVDSAGTVVEGDVRYPDSNTVTVEFRSAFSGKAYLN